MASLRAVLAGVSRHARVRTWSLLLLIPLLASCSSLRLPFSSRELPAVDLEPARALREAGQAREALYDLDRQLARASRQGDRAAIQYERGLCYVELGSDAKATEAFRAARSWARDSQLKSAAAIEIGWCSLRADRLSLAEHHLKQAISLGVPRQYSEDHVRYHLAVICQRLGKEREAGEYHALVRSYRPAPGDPWVYRVPEPEPEKPAAPTMEEGPIPGLIARSRWRARPTGSNRDPMGKISRITIHHTATEDPGRDLARNLTAVRKIQKYHQGSEQSGGRGWADIGYHFLIDASGRIYEGRPLAIQGAHVGGDANRGNIGIALIGSFEAAPPSSAQVRSLRSLVGRLTREYKIPVSGIYAHRQFARAKGKGHTACPGPSVERVIFQLRKDLVAGAGGGPSSRGREVRHVVRRGESLFAIARRYGADLKEIVDSNEIAEPNRIRVGEVLVIPAAAP